MLLALFLVCLTVLATCSATPPVCVSGHQDLEASCPPGTVIGHISAFCVYSRQDPCSNPQPHEPCGDLGSSYLDVPFCAGQTSCSVHLAKTIPGLLVLNATCVTKPSGEQKLFISPNGEDNDCTLFSPCSVDTAWTKVSNSLSLLSFRSIMTLNGPSGSFQVSILTQSSSLNPRHGFHLMHTMALT